MPYPKTRGDESPEPVRIVVLSVDEFQEVVAEAYAAGGQFVIDRLTPLLERLDGPQFKPVLTVKEAARYCKPKVSADTVLRWIKLGLPAYRQEGVKGYRIRRADLEAWLAGETPHG